MTTVPSTTRRPPVSQVGRAARDTADSVLAALGTTLDGLSAAEAARRLTLHGPNAVVSHRAQALGDC